MGFNHVLLSSSEFEGHSSLYPASPPATQGPGRSNLAVCGHHFLVSRSPDGTRINSSLVVRYSSSEIELRGASCLGSLRPWRFYQNINRCNRVPTTNIIGKRNLIADLTKWVSKNTRVFIRLLFFWKPKKKNNNLIQIFADLTEALLWK